MIVLIYDFDGTNVSTTNLHENARRYAGQKISVLINDGFIVYQKSKPENKAAEYISIRPNLHYQIYWF